MDSKPYNVCDKHQEAYPEFAECGSCMKEQDAADEAKRDQLLDQQEELDAKRQ